MADGLIMFTLFPPDFRILFRTYRSTFSPYKKDPQAGIYPTVLNGEKAFCSQESNPVISTNVAVMPSHPRLTLLPGLKLLACISLLTMPGLTTGLRAQNEEQMPGMVALGGIASSDDVYIDDTLASHGPLPPQSLSPGWHRIALFNGTTARTTADWFLIGEGSTTVLTARMNHMSPRSFVPSLLVPGLSQFLQGSRTVGTALFLASVGTGIWAYQAQTTFNDKRKAYGVARSLYVGAHTEGEAVNRRQPMLSAHDDMIKARNMSNTAIISFGVVYLFNVVHTFLYHAEGDDIEVVPQRTTIPTPEGTFSGVSVGVHIPL